MDRMYKGVLSQALKPSSIDLNTNYIVVNASSPYKALLSLIRAFKDREDEVVSTEYLSLYMWSIREHKWIYQTTRRIDSI